MWSLLLFLLGYILLCFLIVTIFYILNNRAYKEGLPKHYADYIIFYTEYIVLPSEAINKRIEDWNERNIQLVMISWLLCIPISSIVLALPAHINYKNKILQDALRKVSQ